MTTPDSKQDVTYPLTKQMNIQFSAYEDRLVLDARRGADQEPVKLLLTRRMVMIVLQQLLEKLTTLSELSKTPAQYWQEVLQMAHQQAMQAQREASMSTGTEPATPSSPEGSGDSASAAPPSLFLATSALVKIDNGELILGFNGLPMPKAMVEPSRHDPILAISLQPKHIHQLIQLLINNTQQASWHLPVDLPWLEQPQPQAEQLGTVLQ